MGMLKSITLKNYKCFEKLKVDGKEELEIAPLTVLCGVNSSGKSSILKSLLMLKQSYENIYDSNSVLFNGDLSLNGTYQDVVYNHKASNYITFVNKFKIENSNFLSSFEKNTIKDLNTIFNLNNDIKVVYITVSIQLKRKNSTKKILDNVIHSYSISIKIILKDDRDVFSNICLTNTSEDKYDIDILVDSLNINVSLLECTCYFNGLILTNLYFTKTNPEHLNTTTILSFIYAIFKIIPLQYKGIKYIAPLRNEPNRIYQLYQERNDVGLYGEYTPQIIYEHRNDNIKFVIPPTNDSLLLARERKHLIDHLNSWCEHLGIDTIVLPNETSNNLETFKIGIGNSNLMDVGFGISQILPILTTCFLMRWHETLILQQPEIHLHPKMQMDFADFILSSAYTGRNIIIETHSDHIINRLVRRILENPTLKDKVKFYFVDKKANPVISTIEVDNVRGFINAPEDFFSQFGDESSKIFNAGISNIKKKIKLE